jgi:hypothetical protein
MSIIVVYINSKAILATLAKIDNYCNLIFRKLTAMTEIHINLDGN